MNYKVFWGVRTVVHMVRVLIFAPDQPSARVLLRPVGATQRTVAAESATASWVDQPSPVDKRLASVLVWGGSVSRESTRATTAPSI